MFATLKSGGSFALPSFERNDRIDPVSQEATIRAHASPKLVHASNPGKDVEKAPLN
jgi:hypothetical protein